MCYDVRRTNEGHGLCEGQEEEWMGCFLNDFRVFGIDERPVDDCSPGRGRMAQNSGIKEIGRIMAN